MCEEKNFWPEGKTCALMLSVNLDVEFYGRIYYPDVDVNSGDILRLGKTGMEYGLPRLLNTLDQYNVKATFFVPGEVARRYEKEVKEISERGHEIGCHGDQHEILALYTRQEQKEILQHAKETLENLTSQNVAGFRMPEGEMNRDTLEILKELGFCYNSSLSDDDKPYIHPGLNLVELPVHWELFDLPYFTFAFDPPIPPGQARSASMDEVLKNWIYELDGAKKFGTLMNLQLDPQTIGEQGRIFMLEELLDRVRNQEDVWIATGNMICQHVTRRRK